MDRGNSRGRLLVARKAGRRACPVMLGCRRAVLRRSDGMLYRVFRSADGGSLKSTHCWVTRTRPLLHLNGALKGLNGWGRWRRFS